MTTLGMGENIITVIQGEYRVSGNPADRLSTVLGSCVSCCLFDASARLGGMNHFILANGSGSSHMDIKYGSYSMEMLINNLLKAGAVKARLKAKLFGGANVTNSNAHIGQQNARFAKEFLRREEIPCVGESLGGDKARRIHFWPTTGAARQFIVPRGDVAPEIVAPPRPKLAAPDIELF